MKRNVGTTDKGIRIVLGLIIILIGFRYGSYWGLAGAVLLVTGLINFCPLYRLLGISTCAPRTTKTSN